MMPLSFLAEALGLRSPPPIETKGKPCPPSNLVPDQGLVGLIIAPHVELVAVFVVDQDLLALGSAHRATHQALLDDDVWRDVLVKHYRLALNYLNDRLAEEEDPSLAAPPSAQGLPLQKKESTVAIELRPLIAISRRLPPGSARKLYSVMRREAAAAPLLSMRARLALMVHELKEWEQVRKLHIMQRQAEAIAEELGAKATVARISALSKVMTLNLVSLQAIAGASGADRSQLLRQAEDQVAAESGPAEASALKRLVQERLLKRKEEWLRQRQDLLRDLEWSGS